MAYAFIIAAVKPNLYLSFKNKVDLNRPLPLLVAEKFIVTTHFYLSAGTGDQLLDIAMTDLLETGQELHSAYWHPYRPPLYQDSETIKAKAVAFKNSYSEMISKLAKDDVQYWNMDFSPIINLVDFAIKNNLSLLTFLEKPQDKERAEKVHYPIELINT